MASRTKKAKINIIVSLIGQVVTFICGIVVPKLFLDAFGSEQYGATSSIGGFLSYITLLDAGVGSVSRAALYKAFAKKDTVEISKCVCETKNFFRKVAYVYIAYIAVIAVFYDKIAKDNTLEFWFTFALVIVIAISSFAEYFIGISYSMLVQADQRGYIINIIKIVTYVLNVGVIILLIKLPSNPSIIWVKLGSSLVFVLRPLLLSVYAKRKYKLVDVEVKSGEMLKQKGYALGNHIAYTVHGHTDTTVLTFFANLSFVSVYSVYHMVISRIQNIAAAFTGDMEAVFGSMMAEGKQETVNRTFGYYETLISLITNTLFSVTAVMMIPFVGLYTAKVSAKEGLNYIYPAFSLMLTVSSVLFCMRQPYGKTVLAAGHFKQTQWAGYGEAIVNMGLSILLVLILPEQYKLLGVAIGTVAATAFRFVYYAVYISKNLIMRPIRLCIKRLLVNGGMFATVYLLGNVITGFFDINNYFIWAVAAVAVGVMALAVTLAVNCVFYFNDVKTIFKKTLSRK